MGAGFFTFDLSRRQAGLGLSLVLGLYLVSAVPEIFIPKDFPDYDFYGPTIAHWEPSQILTGFDMHVKYALSKSSVVIFGNTKVVPLLESVALLLLTYMTAKQLSGRRIGGMVAITILASSNLFRVFDTSAVYDNSWAVFYLLSIYVIPKKWQMSPVFFVMAVACRPLILLFMPSVVMFVVSSTIPPRAKKILYGIFGGIIIAFVVIAPYQGSYENVPFNLDGFISGLWDWWNYMFADLYMMAAIPAMMLLLFVFHKKGVPKTLPLAITMLNLSFYGSIIEGFTKDLWNEPYRYVPLVVFFAISIAVMMRIDLTEKYRKNHL